MNSLFITLLIGGATGVLLGTAGREDLGGSPHPPRMAGGCELPALPPLEQLRHRR